ncbi:MAG: GMC family oxidoreductase, partial [Myxococcota bacterium]
MSERFDAVIVGSGAGGAPVAYTLAQAGAKVLVLEKGPRFRRTDHQHDEIISCRRDTFIPYPEDDPHTIRRDPDASAHPTNAAWTSRCVGGGTVHMSGFFFRLHPEDFRIASTFGPIEDSTIIDWPIAYEDLAPYYDRVEQVVGVSGDTSANPHEPPRSGPFQLPPVQTHPVAHWVDRAGRELGMHPYPVPRAIITQPRDGRGACVYCPLCGSYGCEVGAKSSTADALIPACEQTGRCEVRADAMVQRILMRQDGRAKGVVYVDTNGARHTVDADIVVVAASAIESARLLLMSGSSRHPNGIGNNHGQVGRNLCFSTLGHLTGALPYEGRSTQEQSELRNSSPFIGRAIQDFYRVEPAGDLFGKGGTFHLLWAHPNPIYAAEQLIMDDDGPVYGDALTRRLLQYFKQQRTIEVECFGEWLPTDGCH